MNHSTSRPIKRPSARKLQEKRAPLSALSGYQVGRCVRTWLQRNAALLSIAIGWVFVFAMLAVPKNADHIVEVIELVICGAGALGFGVGWMVRDERGER